MSDGYGVVSLDASQWEPAPDSPAVSTTELTASLGCQHLWVTAYSLPGRTSVALPADREQICVPLGGTAPLALGDETAVSPDGVGRVPAGVAASLGSDEGTTVIVVAAPGAPTPGVPCSAVSLADRAFPEPSTSTIGTARLTAVLGCRGLKVNARLLEPGDVVPYHTEGDQEELFVPVSGPASMRIADATVETPPGTVARVAPEVPRSACNHGETDSYWVMFGAPPTGGPDDWDPGAEVLE